MYSLRNILIVCLIVSCCANASAQVPFSIATDVGAYRNFSKNQHYWSLGQNINGQFHLNAKNTLFAWLSYSNNGKFKENLTATAKDPLTLPQTINFSNKAALRFGEIAFGWKRYLKGTYDAEKNWNLYSLAGLGIMMGRVANTTSQRIDTSLYAMPVLNGSGHFKRLTLDLGLGAEAPLGGDAFLYGETKVFTPLTNYPSPYLSNNDYTPLVGFISLGIRVLFN